MKSKVTGLYLVMALAVVCASVQATPLITDGLYAYYGMEDNAADGVVADGSGNSRTGTLHDASGTATTAAHAVPGVLGGQALAFDGKDDAVAIVGAGVPDYMSVALWVNPNHDYVTGRGDNAYPPAINNEFDFFSTGFNRDVFRMHHDINYQGKFNCRLEADEGGWYTVNSTTTEPKAGTWYHLAATFDGTDLKIYVNGVQEDAIAAGPGKTVQDAWSGMSIGGGFNGSASYYCAPAAIDEVYVFDRALTAQEVATLAVPEPATMCLLALGGFAAALRRRP